MGFHYPLQKIVDLKANERTQAEWVLAEAFGIVNQLQRSLQQMERERTRWIEQINQATQQSTPIAKMQLLYRHLDYLDEQVMRKTEQLTEATTKVEQNRAMLGEKMVTEKVWLKAKENAYSVYKYEYERREQQAVDELVNARFNYNKKLG